MYSPLLFSAGCKTMVLHLTSPFVVSSILGTPAGSYTDVGEGMEMPYNCHTLTHLHMDQPQSGLM